MRENQAKRIQFNYSGFVSVPHSYTHLVRSIFDGVLKNSKYKIIDEITVENLFQCNERKNAPISKRVDNVCFFVQFQRKKLRRIHGKCSILDANYIVNI